MEYREDFNEKLKKLALQWKREPVKLNKGVSAQDIHRLETKVNFKFEEDFRAYLLEYNGFWDFDSDNEFFSFWSIERIEVELNDHPSNLMCFSDYCINLCSYGINLNDGKIYSHFQHQNKLHFISNTFSEFVDLYLFDSDELVK